MSLVRAPGTTHTLPCFLKPFSPKRCYLFRNQLVHKKTWKMTHIFLPHAVKLFPCPGLPLLWPVGFVLSSMSAIYPSLKEQDPPPLTRMATSLYFTDLSLFPLLYPPFSSPGLARHLATQFPPCIIQSFGFVDTLFFCLGCLYLR